MANVVIGKIEVALEDVLHWVSKVQTVILKGPAIITALGVILQQVDKVIADVTLDASAPITLLNVQIDTQQLADIKLVWADIKTAFTAAGVKI